MLRFFRRPASLKTNKDTLAQVASDKFEEFYRILHQIENQQDSLSQHSKDTAWKKVNYKIIPELNRSLLQLYTQKKELPEEISQEKLIEIFNLIPGTLQLCEYPNILERLKNGTNDSEKAIGIDFYNKVMADPKFEKQQHDFNQRWNKSALEFGFEAQLKSLSLAVKMFNNHRDKLRKNIDPLNNARIQALDMVIDLTALQGAITNFKTEEARLHILLEKKTALEELKALEVLGKGKPSDNIEDNETKMKKLDSQIKTTEELFTKAKNILIEKLDIYTASVESALTGKVSPVLLKDLDLKEARTEEVKLLKAYSILHGHHFFSGKAIRGEKASLVVYLEQIKPHLEAVKKEFSQLKPLKLKTSQETEVPRPFRRI